MKRILDIVRRGRAWKEYLQASLLESSARIAALEEQLEAMRHEQAHLKRNVENLKRSHVDSFAKLASSAVPALADAKHTLLLARRGAAMVALVIERGKAEEKGLAGQLPLDMVDAICGSEIDTLHLIFEAESGWAMRPEQDLLEAIREVPASAVHWLEARQPEHFAPTAPYFDRLDAILAELDLIDFFANGSVAGQGAAPAPFDMPELLPPLVPAEPKRRSVLLLHNNYYHFNCLAEGLKSRGWDAVTVSLEAPDSPQRQFYHGEDLNLFDADPALMVARIRTFFRDTSERFGALHFCGMGLGGFFSQNWENVAAPSALPWDLLELRRHNVIIGYMPSGCNDGGLQSSIHALTGGLCERCVWQLRPDVCSDAASLAWNRKLARYCDWVGLEFDHVTPERVGAKSVYGPVVTTLDPLRWHPDIEPPDDMRIERKPGEVLVYHAVGNYEQRRKAGRDIKGTGAVMAAVERLQAEGLPVRLIFAHDVLSTQVRFLQVQADIVVDQLNYGRYGANAREAMMLGKPTICRLTPQQAPPLPPSRAATEAPMLDATESSITDVLRNLVLDPGLRADLGRRARAYAVAWHGQDACAERYEKVIDRIRAGLPPETPELYPPSPDP